VRSITKGAPPVAFLDWLGLANDEWIPTYGNLRGNPMIAVRNALLRESNFLCAYCGRTVLADGSDSHIEHFYPQSKFEDWSVEWWNLFISCGRATSEVTPATCGTLKSDWVPSPDFIIPSSKGCEGRFRYDGLGEIAPRTAVDVAASTMIKKLGLNDGALSLERQQIIAALEYDVDAGELTPAMIPEEIERWRSADSGGRLKAFSQVAARYLEEEPV